MTKTTGYIRDGIYYRGTTADNKRVAEGDSSQYKAWDHNRQRLDHAYELIQPYKEGRPNPEFLEYYPEESRNYGFTKE